MADKIQFYRGTEAGLPTLRPGEPGYCKDTKRLYIGSDSGNILVADNVRLIKVDELKTGMAQLEEDVLTKLTASKVAYQAALAADADLADVISAFNSLVAAMKNSGVMSS